MKFFLVLTTLATLASCTSMTAPKVGPFAGTFTDQNGTTQISHTEPTASQATP